jgi:hypothetical protein
MVITLTPQKLTDECIQLSLPCGNRQAEGNGVLNEIVVHNSVQKPRIKDKYLSSQGARFTNCTKFEIKNPSNFLLAELSGIFIIACPPTWHNIPELSGIFCNTLNKQLLTQVTKS